MKDTKTVYIMSTGGWYHTDPKCVWTPQDRDRRETTLSEAIRQHRDPCPFCVTEGK